MGYRHTYPYIVLQISKEQHQETKQAIASLFQVTDLFTSSGDSRIKAEMMQKKKMYGTLLQHLDLIKMSRDTLEEKTMLIKSGLDSKVRNIQALNL